MNYYILLIEADGSIPTKQQIDAWALRMASLKNEMKGWGTAELYTIKDEQRFKEFQRAMRNAKQS